MPQKVLVITGPTATGKTRLGVLLARRFGGEIVSADSMQVYRGMDIGTAKPSSAEREGIVHHMLDVSEPEEPYSASRYVEQASRCVDGILGRGRLPIIVGGTGLYIDSLLAGRTFAAFPQGLRHSIEQEYSAFGGKEMLRRLAESDPESAARLHENDEKRIVRALEVYRAAGKTITQYNLESRLTPPRYDGLKIALNFSSRDDLYNRIDSRADDMLERGLIDEVRRLIGREPDSSHTSMQAIGYKELAHYILGLIPLETAMQQVKRESRRYAKRQLSWLRREGAVRWIIWDKSPDFESGVRLSTIFMREYGIITA